MASKNWSSSKTVPYNSFVIPHFLQTNVLVTESMSILLKQTHIDCLKVNSEVNPDTNLDTKQETKGDSKPDAKGDTKENVSSQISFASKVKQSLKK